MKSGNNITRRALLQGAGVAAGAVAVPYFVPQSVLGKAAVAPSERIVVGCIGVGNQGTSDMKNFLRKPEAQVVATCDVNKMNLGWATQLVNERYGNQDCKTYADFQDVLARDDVDAVCIATPQHWHVPMALAAAKAGKDIYCEKPMSMAMSWDWELQRVVRRYDVVFQFGTQQRSDARFQHACKLVKNGDLGTIKTIRVWCPNRGLAAAPARRVRVPEYLDHDAWLGPALPAPYWGRPDTGLRSDRSLGNISEWGAHMLDIINLAGQHRPETGLSLEGGGKWSTEGGWEDTPVDYTITMRYGTGVTVEFMNENLIPGFWRSRYLSEPERDRDWGHGIVFEGTEGWVHVDRESINASPKRLVAAPIEGSDQSSGANHVQNFLDCCKSRQEPRANIDAGVEADLLTHLSYIAVETGQPLAYDSKTRTFVDNETANRMLHRALRSPWHC